MARQLDIHACRPFWFLSQFDLCFEVVGSHTLNFRSVRIIVGSRISYRVSGSRETESEASGGCGPVVVRVETSVESAWLVSFRGSESDSGCCKVASATTKATLHHAQLSAETPPNKEKREGWSALLAVGCTSPDDGGR